MDLYVSPPAQRIDSETRQGMLSVSEHAPETESRTPQPTNGSDAERMLREIGLNLEHAADTPEQAILRGKLSLDVHRAHQAGWAVDILEAT